MSSISAINGFSSLWNTTNSVSSSSNTADSLSQMVNNMSGAGGSGSGSSDEDTETTTKIMADGSVMVIVTQGDEVISQTKISSGKNADNNQFLSQNSASNNNPQVAALAGQSLAAPVNHAAQTAQINLDKFNDTSSSIMEGSLFSAGV